MCSDESHFNVSLIVRNKVRRQSPQTTTFLKSRKGELKRNRAEILLLTRLVRTRSRLYWERERERERETETETETETERVSLCRVSLFLCSVGVDCTTAPTPPPPPPHTHTHHPSSQGSMDAWLTCSPPPPTPLPTHTHTQQTSLSLPELCWLHDCLCLCVCSAQLCWRSRGLLHLFLRTAAPTVPTRRHPQQQHRGLWLGCQYGLRWQQVTDPGLPSTQTTAAKSTATQKFPTKRLQRFW